MKRFTADFETATWLEDECYVWAWALCDIENPENVDMRKYNMEGMELIKNAVKNKMDNVFGSTNRA